MLGFFVRLPLGALLGLGPAGLALGRSGLYRGEPGISVPLLGDALASDFRGAPPGLEPCRAQPRRRLTRAVDDGFPIVQPGGQVGCHGFPTTGGTGIQTRAPTVQRMSALADSHPAPAALPCRAPLSAWSPFCDRTCHKAPAGAAVEQQFSFWRSTGIARQFELKAPDHELHQVVPMVKDHIPH